MPEGVRIAPSHKVTSKANFSRPADNVAYQQGDIIANSTTAASVVPITFAVPFWSGYVTGARCVVTPASGNLVITALTFDLLLFRPETDIPFAAGSFPADNTALAVSAAAYREAVGVFSFTASAWRNPAGLFTAGITGYQESAMASRANGAFSLNGLTNQSLIGVVQAQGAWTPTGVVNRFDFTLDLVVG